MFTINLSWSAFLKLSRWLSLSFIAILFSVKAQSEPLGQEIKEILLSDLDRASAMQRKLDSARERRASKRRDSAMSQISQFLQLEREIDCRDDEGALMQALNSDTEASILYLISGRCVIDRYLEIIGRDLAIGSLNSPRDPSIDPEDLATLFFDQQDYKMLVASTGASIILAGLYIESSDQSDLRFIAVRNGYLSLVDTGFKNDLRFTAASGGGIQLFDSSNVQWMQEATKAQKALVEANRNWNLRFEMSNSASASVIGASFNVAFRLEGNAALNHISMPTQLSLGYGPYTAAVSYELTNSSSATIRNFYAPISVQFAYARSNSSIGHEGIFEPEELIVSPTSYVGPLVD